MVDDDRRRETARRLRAAAKEADPAAGVPETEIFCILDVDMGGERGFADRQDVLRLADLIDRPATQGSGNRRAATCEDIDFLIALQEEMNTQPHVGQADPRFWVVQVSSYRDATDADDIDRVRFIDDEWIETDRMTLDEAMEAAYRAEAEAMEQTGIGIANQRKAIAEGISSSLETIQRSGVTPEEANDLFLYTQWAEMMGDFAKSGKSSTVVLPSGYDQSAATVGSLLAAGQSLKDERNEG